MTRYKQQGFSLIELMIALVLGLVMVGAFGTIYFSSQGASRRVEQLSELQASVRTAFEYFSNDVHAVGLTGCQQGRETGFTPPASTSFADNFAVSIEGFDAASGPSFPLATSAASNTWSSNQASAGGTATAFTPTLLGDTAITQGSDIVFLRTVGSRPLRLSAATPSQLSIETVSLGGTCSNPSTSRQSGFCSNNYGLISNCRQAEVFRVSNVANVGTSTDLTLASSLSGSYSPGTAEVFPLQTVMYYVRPGSQPNSQSLYRRVFDGDDGTTNGEEQELIENVENLQLTYGVDMTDNADGSRNFAIESYVTADDVSDWSRVLAVRMSLLLRASAPIRVDAPVAASASVNGVVVDFPDTGDKYDRRVFTTTVALRNRVALN